MKKKPVNQEILLVTSTTFAGREWHEKDGGSNSHKSRDEQLEEACWNGLLEEMLPGLIERAASGNRLFLWQIIRCSAFLEIDLSEIPVSRDSRFSVNPHNFLPLAFWN